MNEFQISPENEELLTLDDAKFIFDQAEKQLKISLETGQTIVTRTIILLTISVGLLTSLSGNIAQNWNKSGWTDLFTRSSVLIDVYLIAIVLYLAKNIVSHNYMEYGSEPKDLLHNHYVEKYKYNSEERIRYYYLSEAKEYQKRITYNQKGNSIRWKQFGNALYAILLIPIISTVVYSLIYLL